MGLYLVVGELIYFSIDFIRDPDRFIRVNSDNCGGRLEYSIRFSGGGNTFSSVLNESGGGWFLLRWNFGDWCGFCDMLPSV